MSNWQQTTLGAVCKAGGGNIQTGPFGSQLHASDYVESGIPSVMPQNIGNNRIIDDGIARITEDDAHRLSKYRLHTNDIVYSRRGDVERRALVRTENDGWLCGTGCLKVSFGDHPVADPAFVSYFLGTPSSREWIVRHAVGATMLNLNTKILESVPLQLPSLTEQQDVAKVLGALDDKIATNTKIAQTARELAQAEFIQLMKTASKPTTLRDVLRLEYGKSLATKKRVEGDADVFGSGGIVGTHNEPLLPGPGVIVGRKGTAGSVHWAPRAYFPIDTTFYVVPTEPDFSLIFCFHLLKSLPLSEMNSDSAVPGLNREEALSIPIRVPEKSEIQDFSIRADHFFSVVQQSGQESSVLVSMRDALLPHLMSGKLRVEDAEKVIKETL